MSNVLRSTPGLSIVRYPSSRGVYNVVGTARGTARIAGSGRRGPPICPYQIYVDGVKQYAPSADLGADPPPDIDTYKVNEYEAVEIYRGGAQVPSQYGGTGAACGTVLFWTRTR
jgi:hypothetical protein